MAVFNADPILRRVRDPQRAMAPTFADFGGPAPGRLTVIKV